MKISSLLPVLLLSLQTFAQDYWSKIPIFTNSCYQKEDTYLDKLDALRTELKQKIDDEQKKLQSRFDNMTEAEKQKLAMEMSMKYMSMSPDEIMEMQNVSLKQAELAQAQQESSEALTSKYAELEKAYYDERKSDLEPLTEEARKLPDGEGTPDWAIEKSKQLASQYDTKYKAICSKYFSGSNALFVKWLAEYKQFVLEHVIPYQAANFNAQMQQYGMPPSTSPATEWEGINQYIDQCLTVFQLREFEQKSGL